jgi:SAM-dependent methyltransferase
VDLIDPVEEQVAEAQLRAGTPPAFTARLGDARDLSHPDASCDAVLLLGPLYHLVDRDDRIRALEEARRVLKPGGVVFGAAISRFASLHDGLARGFIFDPTFQAIVEADLSSGQHRNSTDRPEWFTTAYFHHPAELRDEAQDSGLLVREVVGLEGLGGWLPNVANRWEDGEARETILSAARSVESEPSLLGLSAHLLIVAARP